MKESIEKDGTIIKEWTFKEWKEGKSPVIFHRLLNDKGNKRKDIISNADYQKLRQAQQESYQEAVKRAFDKKKVGYERKLAKSKDKARFKSKMIARVENQLTKPDSKNGTVDKSSFNYWREYDEVIIEGKDGSIVHYPYHNNARPNAIRFIEVEAIKMFLDYLTNNASKKPPIEPLSYQWRGDADQDLPELYKRMTTHYELIEPNSFEKFNAIFTGQPLSEIQPISWKSKSVLLAYFLKCLETHRKLKGDCDLWSIAENCFIGYNRKNLGQAYQNTLNNKTGRPRKHELIDSLFKFLG